MANDTWIEIVDVDNTVEAVCTLVAFRAANEEAFDAAQWAEIEALDASSKPWMFGGGAAPEQAIRVLGQKQAAALDMICEACGGVENVEVIVGYDTDEAPMPFSIWATALDGADHDIVGAGNDLASCIADALDSVAKWQVAS